jgi:fermentation-respiration switch protein FrsA (DUF1100 family)
MVLVALVGALLAANPAPASPAVEARHVEFQSGGQKVVGTLFVPGGIHPGQKTPALVVSGPLSSVKEQAAGLYAKRFAEQGFIGLAFDPRHFGESEGQPRQLEDPTQQVEDLKSALTFLSSLPEVDGQHLGAVGIGHGAGVAARAAADDKRLKVLVAVAGFFGDAAAWKQTLGDARVAELNKRGKSAKQKFDKSKDADTAAVVSATETTVALPGKDMFDYFSSPRGNVPNWKNQLAVMSWEPLLSFDAVEASRNVVVPTLMVHSDKASSPDAARRAFVNIHAPKELYWMESSQQSDFYDQPKYVNEAAAESVRWLSRFLKQEYSVVEDLSR